MISIAMTTYNGERFLKQQLDSILAQTYSDFELIICDDGSKDSTRNQLQKYADNDSRIKLYFNEQNLGFIKNFEKAIGLCTGDFIAMADQDDIWTTDHLEVLVNNIGNHYLICSNAELVDYDGNSLGDFVRAPSFLIAENMSDQIIQQLVRNTVQGCTALFRKELLQFAMPIPAEAIAHDAWLGDIACLVPNTNGLEGITYIPNVTLKYRQHGDNTVGAEKAGTKRNINHFNRSSFFVYKELDLFMTAQWSKQLPDSTKTQLLESTKVYIHQMSYKASRIKAIPFFLKHAKSIYAQKSFNTYIILWFIKLFILLN